MYAKKHRPMQKLTAICLSVTIAAASLLSGHVFASDEAPQTDYLTGQELLAELREMGLGQDVIPDELPPDASDSSETNTEDPSDTTGEPGDGDQTGGTEPGNPDGNNPGEGGSGEGDPDPGESIPEQPGEGGGSTETPVEPSDPAQPGGDGDGGTTEPSDPALPEDGGDNTGSEDPAESTDPTEDPSGETDSETSGETDSGGAVTEPPVDSEQPAESETPAASTDDAQEENQPVVIGRVPLMIDNDEVTVEEPTTVEDEDKTPAESSGSDDGETPPTGNTSDEEPTSGEDGSTNPPESQNPSEPSSEPSTPTTPGEGETTPPTGEDGGNTGEPVDPDFGVETPVDPDYSVEIPSEDVPGVGEPEYTLRDQLIEYVAELEIEQIASVLDHSKTDITDAEEQDLYSVMTPEMIDDLVDYLNSNWGTNVTDAAPLVENETQKVSFMSLLNALNEEDPLDALKMSKNAVYNEETDTVDITLDAYTTGKVTTTKKSKPADIVLVLDQSGSMDQNFGTTSGYVSVDIDDYRDAWNNRSNLYVKIGGEYRRVTVSRDWEWYEWTYSISVNGQTFSGSRGDSVPQGYEWYRYSSQNVKKIDALKEAVNAFIAQVNEDARENSVDHRIAIVGFGVGNYDYQWYYTNTEVFIGEKQYRYDQLDHQVYQQAFQAANTVEGVGNLEDSVKELEAEGATRSDLGLEMAANIFSAHSADYENDERNKVVIMFTDGAPTTFSENFDKKVANAAIRESKDMKEDGVTVYSVGVLPNAQVFDQEENNLKDNVNRYMHYTSSNYPDAAKLDYDRYETKPEAVNEYPDSYYLTASDTEGLNDIFESIGDQIQGSTDIELGADAVVKDYISDYFQIPEGFNAAKNVTVYRSEFDGTTFGEWKAYPNAEVEVDPHTKEIVVSGFDFDTEFVTKEAKEDGTYGAKLVIVITGLEPRTGFLGGNGVPTNGDGSGVYGSNDELVKSFDPPTVDVPINEVTVTAKNKNVYLLGDLTDAQMKKGATASVEDAAAAEYSVHLDLTKDDFGLTWQDDFVNITVTTTPPTGNDTGLTQDSTFTLAVSVSPETTSGTATEQKGSDEAKVNVFKPEITWKDSAINAGETPDYDKDNFVKVEWKHTTLGTAGDSNVMIDTAPELTYAYTPPAAPLNQETLVNVTVSIDGKNVDDHVTHLHENCTFDGCQWEDEQSQCEFIVHIKSFDLTVKKTVTGGDSGNDSFRFTVTGPEGFETSFTLKADESITLKDLPSGTYTVTEDQSWSWRYDVEGDAARTIGPDSIENGKATVTFTNQKTDNHWLSWEDTIQNIFKAS